MELRIFLVAYILYNYKRETLLLMGLVYVYALEYLCLSFQCSFTCLGGSLWVPSLL